MPAVAGATGALAAAAEAKPFYIKFHYRGCSLHFLCYFYYKEWHALPQWLMDMAKAVPFQHYGKITYQEACAKWIATSTALSQAQSITWMDITMQLMEAGWATSFASGLQARVLEICPEHAHAINDWKNFGTLIQRVGSESFKSIDAFMETNGMSTVPLPQRWLREPELLLWSGGPKKRKHAQTCDKGSTGDEQLCAIGRLLQLVKHTAQAENKELPDILDLSTIWAKIDKTRRSECITVAKKFAAGMEAVEQKARDAGSTGDEILAWNTPKVHQKFLQGDFDEEIRNTHNPAQLAPFWSFVKAHSVELSERRKKDAATTAEAVAKAAQTAAEDAAKALQESLSQVEQDDATSNMVRRQQLGQLFQTYCTSHLTQLQLQEQRHREESHHLYREATEMLARAENKRGLEMECPDLPAAVIKPTTSQHKRSHLVIEGMDARGSLPNVTLLDAGYSPWDADDVKVAMQSAGENGAVVLVTSGVGAIVAAPELQLLAKLDPAAVSQARVYMSWKAALPPTAESPQKRQDPADTAGPTRSSGWATILCNHPSWEAA